MCGFERWILTRIALALHSRGKAEISSTYVLLYLLQEINPSVFFNIVFDAARLAGVAQTTQIDQGGYEIFGLPTLLLRIQA